MIILTSDLVGDDSVREFREGVIKRKAGRFFESYANP